MSKLIKILIFMIIISLTYCQYGYFPGKLSFNTYTFNVSMGSNSKNGKITITWNTPSNTN
jgi:hypothetical protein